MAGNKTVYTLDLDTSKLISKYKDAISQMEKAGVSGDITKGLTQGLEKLAKEYKGLETAGKAGFTNSKQIENFQKRVEKLMTSFRGFESELGGVSKKIEDVAKKSSDASKKLSSAFSKFGFKDVAKQMDAINNATDREAKLSEIVKAELEARAKAVVDLKVKYNQAAQAATQASQKANSIALGTNQSSKYSSGESIWTGGKNKVDNSVKQVIVEQAKAIAKAAEDGETAWAEFNNYLKTNGLEKAFNQRALAPLEQTIKDMQAGFNTAAPAIEEADKALEELNAAEQSFNQIGKNTKDGIVARREVYNQLKTNINEVEKAESDISEVMEDVKASSTDMANAQKQAAKAANDVTGAAVSEESAVDGLTSNLQETVETAEKTAATFEKLKSRVLTFFSVTSIFNAVRKEIKKTYEDVKQLDKSFASIAMVTKYSVNQMWSSYSQYADMAAQLGQRTNDIIQASALFYQQGLDTNEALELTTDTMKLATLAGTDFSAATQEMTSAIRGFKMEMGEGAHVTDVYSELAAHAAATVDQIAQAMARTASIANSAGMSFENTSAFLAQMIETTQESAENIGTSLKTIIARFTELKENIANTSDSQFDDLEYNKVDKALKSIGVSLKDANGQFRDLDEVFLELSQKWDSLDRNTQRYIATIAAGSRQQSRFIAMMDNYDRTRELMEYAANAEGKADEQFAKRADTIEYKLNQLNITWEKFKINLLDQSLFKNAIDGINELVKKISQIDIGKMIVVAPLAIKAAKSFILNFIQQFKKSSTALNQAADIVIGSVSKRIKKYLNLKFNLSIDYSQNLSALKTQLEKVEEEIKKRGLKVSLDIKAQDIEPLMGKILELSKKHTDASGIHIPLDDMTKAFKELGYSGQQLDKIFAELGLTEADLNQKTKDNVFSSLSLIGSYKEMPKRIKEVNKEGLKTNQVMQSIKTSLYQVSSGLTIMFSSMYSGIDIIDAANLSIDMFGTQLITLATTAIPQTIVLLKAQSEAAKIASEETKAAAAEAKSALVSTGWGALIVAAGLLIAGLTKLYGSLEKNRQKKIELASSTSNLKKQQEALNEAITESKQKASELRNELDKTTQQVNKLEEAYDNYLNKIYLTTDETEEFKNISQELAELLPEVVNYYDNEGNAVLKDRLEIEKLLEAKRELLNQQNEAVAKQDLNTTLQEYALANSELKTYESLRNIKDNKIFEYMSKTATEELWNLTNFTSTGKDTGEGEFIHYGWFQGLEKLNWDEISIAQYLQGLASGDIENYGNATDIYNYIYKALEAEGLTSDFGVNEGKWKDGYEAIIEKLEEGDAVQERETRVKFQEALSKFPEKLNELYNEAVKKAADKTAVNNQLRTTIEAEAKANSKKYADASENVQSIMTQYLIDKYQINVDELEDNFKTGIGKDFIDKNGKVLEGKEDEYSKKFAEYLQDKVNDLIDTDKIKEELEKKIPQVQDYIDNFYEEVAAAGLDSKGILKKVKSDVNNGLVDKDTAKAIAANYTDVSETNKAFAAAIGEELNLKEDEFGLATSFGVSTEKVLDFYNRLGTEAGTNFTKAIEKAASEYNKYFAKEQSENLANNLSGASDEVLNYLLGKVDWEKYSLINANMFKQTILNELQDTYKLSEDEANQYYNNLQTYAEQTGQIMTDYLNLAQLSAWTGGIEKITEAIQKNDDIIKQYAGNEQEYIAVSTDDYQKLLNAKEALINAGISEGALKDAMYYDEATKHWVLNGKKWNEIIKENAVNTAELLQKQLEENKAKLDSNELSKTERQQIMAANEEIEKAIKKQSELNQLTAATLGYWQSITEMVDAFANLSSAFGSIGKAQKDNGFIGVKEISQLNQALEGAHIFNVSASDFVNDQLQLNIDALYNYINAQITEKETSGLVAEGTEEEILMWKALKKELIATKNEVNAAASTIKDNAKSALENYQKQLDTVSEKQQSLNDKLKEYNELLYGTNNRKSGLDLLYNYEQAIAALNDEMEKSKELLGDSKTTDEAYENLRRYTTATHNYIVEEKARQQVIQQGLSNYANMIENGSASYIDTETGKQINVNFGAYTKKDERTGKYILDQRLIEESKFTDKYKSLIEEQISTYNDYVDKYKDTEDKILKLEKEIQKQREDAVKNYAAMEKTIADALKAQYQEEVDALKNKYDAMKDADDDYIDALQEAIEQQRKLRDQEKAWDELTTKEKKLSLISRDTSGANELDAQKLEKEIEDDRQNLLDQAIDNVIDGLDKLYESQQELRDSEIELKEALLDDNLYWNSQAEGLTASLNSAEDYAALLISLSEEYGELSLAMQEEKLNEYGEQFSSASMYLAMTAMDTASETGDFVVDTMTITGEEVNEVVASTAEAFTTEVIRAYNETTDAFIEDLKKAELEIQNARNDLNDAILKLDELARKANEAAAALENANTSVDVQNPPEENDNTDEVVAPETTPATNDINLPTNSPFLEKLKKINNGLQDDMIYFDTNNAVSSEDRQMLKDLGYYLASEEMATANGSGTYYHISKDEKKITDWVVKNLGIFGKNNGHKKVKMYETGGVVDYTGPAWVDGTPDRPEAFLSSEDTERIGNAAKILADIPWIERDTDNTSVITNNAGDVNIEINLNIDHISSETDIDEMIDKIKEEIVDIANPEGTNVILQQQLN